MVKIFALLLLCGALLSCATAQHKSKKLHFQGKNEWKGMANNFREPVELEKLIEEFLGTPYLLGGNSKEGMDCSALVKQAYAIYEIDLPRTAILQSKLGIKIPKSALLPGDLVFFGETENDSATHVGIYMGNNKFANATSSQGIKYSDLNEPFFFSKYLFAKRLK
ncbi:MAG: C40 family peptidase [Fibromonadaceae bacterium]|jgi:cell wall-associated NlpC family hydrolase|nr:C40 family peptidase [Fibromonadaceae bacterium]